MITVVDLPVDVRRRILGGFNEPCKGLLDLQSLIFAFRVSKGWAETIREATDAEFPGLADAVCREVKRVGLDTEENERPWQDRNEWACKLVWIESFMTLWPVSQLAMQHALSIVSTYEGYTLSIQVDLLIYAWGGRGFPTGAQLFEKIKATYQDQVLADDSVSVLGKSTAINNAVKMLLLCTIGTPPSSNSDAGNPKRQVFLQKYFALIASSEPLQQLCKGAQVDRITYEQAKQDLWKGVGQRGSFWNEMRD
jgi:hypothetical protein